MRKHSRRIKAKQLRRARWGLQWQYNGPMYCWPHRDLPEPGIIDYDIL